VGAVLVLVSSAVLLAQFTAGRDSRPASWTRAAPTAADRRHMISMSGRVVGLARCGVSGAPSPLLRDDPPSAGRPLPRLRGEG